MAPTAVPDPSAADGHEREISRLLGGRQVRRAVARLRPLCGTGRATTSACPRRARVRSQGKPYPSCWAPPQLVGEEVRTPAEHISHAAACVHPAATEGAGLPDDARAAVAWLAGELHSGGAAAAIRARAQQLKVLRRVKAELASVNTALEPHVAENVKQMPHRVDIALLHAVAEATGSPDVDIAVRFARGFPACGLIPPSGWWDIDVTPADKPWSDEQRAAWVDDV